MVFREESEEKTDVFDLLLDFQKQYRNVFITKLGEEVFIYRALGRKEYKDILTDQRFNDFQKEELICNTCLLYPDPDSIDWDNVDAGLPTELMAEIRKNSYLDNMAARRNALDFYRNEMFDLDNQITCIINEAFPNFDIEEIEEWDIEKTMKYLTRAEWKLTNLRGLQYKDPRGAFFDEEERMEAHTEELGNDNTEEKTIRGGSKKDKLTPDKAKGKKNAMSIEELRKKFPDVDWGEVDHGLQGIKGMQQDDVDVTSPALRIGM